MARAALSRVELSLEANAVIKRDDDNGFVWYVSIGVSSFFSRNQIVTHLR
jgi:hypothetical protein